MKFMAHSSVMYLQEVENIYSAGEANTVEQSAGEGKVVEQTGAEQGVADASQIKQRWNIVTYGQTEWNNFWKALVVGNQIEFRVDCQMTKHF